MEKTNIVFGGVKWMLMAAVAQKIVTFSLNQCILAWTTPEVFGVAAIQLELLLSTLLFVSREGIRLAAIRASTATEDDRQRLVNLSWIPSFVVFVASLCCLAWSRSYGAERNSGSSKVDPVTVSLYCLGALLETFGEPLLNLFQTELLLRPKIAAEMVAVTVRSIATFVFVALLDCGVRGFGLAQVSYGAAYFLVLLAFRGELEVGQPTGRFNCFPRKVPVSTPSVSSARHFVCQYFDLGSLELAVMSTSSSVLKHLLTEADKVVLTIFASSYDQGIFAVASNYGSLVTRMVFLPFEDAARLIFSKHCAEIESVLVSKDKASLPSSAEVVTSMETILSNLLRCIAIFGALFAVFGPPFVPVLVKTIFSSRWRSAESVATLQSYCFYLLFLGVNGTTEAFVQSVASVKNVWIVNSGLILSTIIYVGSAVALTKYFGTTGLVWAGCASMVVRIALNSIFIQRFVSGYNGKGFLASNPLKCLVPPSFLFLAVLVAVGGLNWSYRRYMDLLKHASNGKIMNSTPWSSRDELTLTVQHVGTGVASLALVVAVGILSIPRKQILEVIQSLRRNRGPDSAKSKGD